MTNKHCEQQCVNQKMQSQSVITGRKLNAGIEPKRKLREADVGSLRLHRKKKGMGNGK